MSIIVKDSANDIWLYCKGADSSVLPLIVQGKVQEASLHVDDFSMVCCLGCNCKLIIALIGTVLFHVNDTHKTVRYSMKSIQFRKQN